MLLGSASHQDVSEVDAIESSQGLEHFTESRPRRSAGLRELIRLASGLRMS